jgi:phosphoglycolate phosphatase-like HAD superfamily hydrolase
MEPIDGTVELVRKLHQEGHSIIFLTKRRRFNNDPPLVFEKDRACACVFGSSLRRDH